MKKKNGKNLTEKQSVCLVLSGGGTKGVYHIGVWKALRELGIKPTAFIGNSIGAIMAGFMAQDEWEAMEEIGRSISIDYILNVPDDMIENDEIKIKLRKMSKFKSFYKDVVRKQGLDTTPLRKHLQEHLDEQKIRNSGNDLGMVTFNLSNMKPREVFLENIEDGELINYIMASSAMPGFEPAKIDGKKYIDGGVYDNIPLRMARARGYKNIIVVDISGLGVRRKPDFTGCTVTHLKNSINMGSVLDFSRDFLDDYRDLGYLDTMRSYGKLHGYRYFIEPEPELEKVFSDYLKHSGTPMPVLPKYAEFDQSQLLVLLDCAASILRIKRIRKWNYRELLSEIMQIAKQVTQTVTSEKNKTAGKSAKSKRRVKGILKAALKKNAFDKTPYYYLSLMELALPPKVQKALKQPLYSVFPELEAGYFAIEHAEQLNTIISEH